MKEVIFWIFFTAFMAVFAAAFVGELYNSADCKAKGGVYMQTFGSMECLDVKTIK